MYIAKGTHLRKRLTPFFKKSLELDDRNSKRVEQYLHKNKNILASHMFDLTSFLEDFVNMDFNLDYNGSNKTLLSKYLKYSPQKNKEPETPKTIQTQNSTNDLEDSAADAEGKKKKRRRRKKKKNKNSEIPSTALGKLNESDVNDDDLYSSYSDTQESEQNKQPSEVTTVVSQGKYIPKTYEHLDFIEQHNRKELLE